ncbi:MAG: helix-turn-helix transcriptional regulator [Oscillibacter sp.]|jgi:transcriptional regulator with XRE-family HTH domain|nr:helix-turn-helix transcriptional regulator [Oscillibacter sp.]
MELGEKLRQARLERRLTQEALAERLGVSRQTVSNWENNRSYPDVMSVIALSEEYSISLDDLLKGDRNMLVHLEESTNVVRSRQRLTVAVLLTAYLVIWAAAVLFFWLRRPVDAMGYSLIVLYFLLPVSTLVLSALLGRDTGWRRGWWALLFFGILFFLAEYGTFSLANMLEFHKINPPDWFALLPGTLCAAVGLSLGAAMKALAERRKYSQSP